MSFPRAKLQRFNDIQNDVPSPTKYDPKVGDKVRGGCILKSEAKHSDNISISSSKSGPFFRTPLIPKKHNCLGVTPSSEKSTPASFKSISLKHEDYDFLSQAGESEDLNALQNECKNKNEIIAELEKFVQELKLEIADHERNKSKLDACIIELEATKSNLECIKSNHDNYEQQIKNYEEKINQLEEQMESLGKAKEELILKIEETEKKNNKLEEVNLDCERKIISLEGTIEQLQGEIENNQKAIYDLKHHEEVNEMNYTVSVECLKGKISALDNEIKELENNKSKNEATIFGLETQISTLNSVIENLKKENCDIKTAKAELEDKLTETEEILKKQKEAYDHLGQQLGDRTKEIRTLNDENKQLKSDFEAFKLDYEKEKNELMDKNKEIASFYENKLKEVEKGHSSELNALNDEISDLKNKVTEQQKIIEQKEAEFSSTMTEHQSVTESQISSLKEELAKKEAELQEKIKHLQNMTDDLLRKHAEEIHVMQNEYETKLLEQMQEYTDKIGSLQEYIDEKEALLKETNQKYLRLTSEAKIEFEKNIQQTEKTLKNLISEMTSSHLLEISKLKDEHIRHVECIELNWGNKVNSKEEEITALTKRYKDVMDEMQDLLKDIDKKDEEMKKLTAVNDSLNGRLKIMLEEIKILNMENETKCKSLQEMASKYEDEALRNAKLSEKLGELDCKLSQQKEELRSRTAEEERLAVELKKVKEANACLHMRKYDLEITIVELRDNINNMTTNMNMERVTFENKLQKETRHNQSR
ncbi:UNVERIFIED_CONTAM: hypothetical protein PYX00_000500 [Menopon gallinae]|uniref:Hyaluronan mediated motility receptor n=1 Tax=Menopon gallinae TaxID=328185 RepID=A0AAW2I9E8_9NEOP